MSLRLRYLKTIEYIKFHTNMRYFRNLYGRLRAQIIYKRFYLKQDELTKLRIRQQDDWKRRKELMNINNRVVHAKRYAESYNKVVNEESRSYIYTRLEDKENAKQA